MTNHLETVARKVLKQAEITWQISVLIDWDERTRQTDRQTIKQILLLPLLILMITTIIIIVMMMLLT